MKKIFSKYMALAYGTYFNGLSVFSKERAAESAFRLFCTPRRGKVLPHQEAYLKEAKNEVLCIAGTRIQTYQWQGNRETVLLLHGWESNVFRWRNLIGFLQREGYRIVAFDAPGHGNSSGSLLNVPLYSQCAQSMVEKYSPKHIIGHSVGGMATLYQQYRHPSPSVEKLVTLGAPSDLGDIMGHYQRLLRFNDRVLQGLDDYFIKNHAFRIQDFSTSQFVKHIPKKGLLIHDIEDTIAPFSASKKVHAEWENSILIPTKGLGHSLHQDEINQQIVDFLKP